MKAQEIIKLPENWKLVAIRPYSPSKGDDYLAVVLATSHDDTDYATWVYNYTTSGCCHGHYFEKDAEAAFFDFLERSVRKARPEPKTETEGFTCPKCGSHRLEEVMTGVTVTSSVISVRDGGDIEYGLQSNEDGEVDCYQCMDCGLAIEGVIDSVGLFMHLKDK